MHNKYGKDLQQQWNSAMSFVQKALQGLSNKHIPHKLFYNADTINSETKKAQEYSENWEEGKWYGKADNRKNQIVK